MAGPFLSTDDEFSHFVPADKKLTPAWLKSLTERGTARALRGAELNAVGMPIGGVAAGQMYLRGDGSLAGWQIFNQPYFSGYGRDNYDQADPESPVDQGFAVVIDDATGRNVVPLTGKGFEDVEFIGEYPIGRVRYHAPDRPVAVELEAFSPFIPLNATDSALPATMFHITVRNTSSAPVTAGVAAWLENAVCLVNAPRLHALRRSRIIERGGRSAIAHSIETAPARDEPARPTIVLADFEARGYGDWQVEGDAFGDGPAHGTLPGQQNVSGFLGQGLVNTFLGGDAPRGRLTSPEFEIARSHLNFLIGGGNHPAETVINLLVDGEIVRTATGESREQLRWTSWSVREFTGRTARLEIVDRHSGGWGHINVDQIELSDEPRFGTGGPIETLEDFGTLVLMHDGAYAPGDAIRGMLDTLPLSGSRPQTDAAAYPADERRSTVVTTPQARLDPGEERTFTFVLAWHFPNGRNGHEYAARFPDATAVADHVLREHDRLANETRHWHETFYESTLPRWLLARVHSTVGNLATGTCQWWKNGRFWAWEGVGCCHGTCTHVWNYAQALGHLFPSLERSAREMQDLGAALHESGLVGFRGERNEAYAADGQAGTVLKCYREHRLSADDAFLARNWPSIRRVLEYSIRQDADDDGLIENSQHNTFDIDFHGPNTFVGSLYLAALRAGEEMARRVGDDGFADHLHGIFECGSRLSVERLFDGEYFVQRVDLAAHPKHQYGLGCLSDQLFGQGWAHQLGLGYLYPREHVRTALESVWRYNWAPDVRAQNEAHRPERWFARPGEAGLFTCTWPRSAFLSQGVRYRNEVWTGIEYQVAGHMIREGMVTEGLAIVRAIDERYDARKRNPYNEVECGDHYARALASWGVFTALCGYEYDGPRGHIGFAPRLTPRAFRGAFTGAEGWGVFEQTIDDTAQRCAVEVRWGRLRLASLSLEIAGPRRVDPSVTVTVGGRPAKAHARTEGARLHIALVAPAIIAAGERLHAVIA